MTSTPGVDMKFLKRCLWATGWGSAGVAIIGWELGAVDWAGRYSMTALFAWINWYLLSRVLVGLVNRRWIPFLLAMGGKILNLGWFVGAYVPIVGGEPTSLLAGINTFFVVILLKLLGRHLSGRDSYIFSQSQERGRPTASPPPSAGPTQHHAH